MLVYTSFNLRDVWVGGGKGMGKEMFPLLRHGHESGTQMDINRPKGYPSGQGYNFGSTGAIMPDTHSHDAEFCPDKSKSLEFSDRRHCIWITIRYSRKLS